MATTAIDYGPLGEDPTNGAGLLDCFEALGPPDAFCMDVDVPTDPGDRQLPERDDELSPAAGRRVCSG